MVSGMVYMHKGLTKYRQGSILGQPEPSFNSTQHHSIVVMCCGWDGQCCWGITRCLGTSNVRWVLAFCWKGSIDSPTVVYSTKIQTASTPSACTTDTGGTLNWAKESKQNTRYRISDFECVVII